MNRAERQIQKLLTAWEAGKVASTYLRFIAISELDMHISILIIDGQALLLANDRGDGSGEGGGAWSSQIYCLVSTRHM